MTGYRTYISLMALAIYNIVLPWLGIKDITMDAIDTAVNVVFMIAIAVFHKLHKPKG